MILLAADPSPADRAGAAAHGFALVSPFDRLTLLGALARVDAQAALAA